MRSSIIGLLVSSLLPLTALGEPINLKVGVTNSLADVGLFVADKRGYFAEQNIKVEFVAFDAAARMIAPFASGDLDVGGGGVSAGLFNAVKRGVGLRIVADKSTSAPGVSASSLVVRKKLVASGQYKSPVDLKGRKIGAPAPGTATSTSLDLWFTKHGFSLKDVDMTYMSFPQMAQALLNDAIDGAFLTEPSLSKALTAGAAEIIAPDHVMFPNHQIAVTLFSERFIKRDRKVAVGFMKAMLRGSRDYMSVVRDGRLTGPGAEEMIAILTEYSAIKDPQVYRSIGVHFCDPNGAIDTASLATDLAWFRKEGLIEGDVQIADALDATIAAEAAGELGPWKRP